MNKISFILKGYLSWIWYYIYAPYRRSVKEEAKRRIKICESCEYFNSTLRSCEVCGCLMDVKTKMIFPLDEEGISIGGCLERKW